MKDELIIGQWYKLSSGSAVLLPDEIWYMKFSGLGENKKVTCSEYIEINRHRVANEHFGSFGQYIYTLIDISEIQEFLPGNHPDKIKVVLIEDTSHEEILIKLLKDIKHV